MLKHLALPENVPKTIKCRICGEPMYWLQINPQIGYWLHHGKSIDVCAQKNPFHPGKPVIAQNLHFYKKMLEVWKEIMEVKQKDATKNTKI